MMLGKVVAREAAPDIAAAIDRLVRAIEGARVGLATETETQDQLAPHLAAACESVEREHRLSEASRVDFMCRAGALRIGVEVKINKGARSAIYRQLRRYVDTGQIDGLVLATNRAMALPEFIGAAPVRIASLGRAWL